MSAPKSTVTRGPRPGDGESAAEPEDPRPSSHSSGSADQHRDPRLNALLDAIAEGRTIDWEHVRREYGLAEDVVRQFEVLAGVAAVRPAPRDNVATSSTSLGHVMAATTTEAPADITNGTTWGPLLRFERVGSGAFGDV